ncbi:hypothetical protein [Corynebacterium gottingense]|uniref:hypothetical protein n=3 Tax=Corynebacterium TaxID=1716 RepID=UPI0011C4A93B|nr:hypothetical protein [Corynebacterium gottingense]
MQDWQILKLPSRADPTRRGKNRPTQQKNSYKTRIKSRTITSKHHLQLEVHKQRHRHTPTTQNVQPAQHRHATNPQTKVHWHTIEFSNNTRTPDQPVKHNQSVLGSGKQRYTQGKQKSKSRKTSTKLKQPSPQHCEIISFPPSDSLALGNEEILNHEQHKHANPQHTTGFWANENRQQLAYTKTVGG